MTDSFDVAIVGSGIVGLGAAYAALKRGKSVVVIDRTAAPVGASIRNFGHLCIGAQSGTAREYANVARPLWLQLAHDAGFWVKETGTLIAARHEDELSILHEAAGTQAGDIEMLDGAELDAALPLRPGVAIGGARITPDLQTDPRSAVDAIRSYLAIRGVEFRLRTSVTGVGTSRVNTTRGDIDADLIVVAVNHDLDQLLPELAESAGVVRCALDMMRVRATLSAPITSPLLTGWSLLRYSRFSSLSGASALKKRLYAERPDLANIDLNQMYTQLPDGSILVGDSHWKSPAPAPFQAESTFTLLRDEFDALFGVAATVVERWQGVYASGPDEFLVAEPRPGVKVLTATSGIGMTTGLGLAEVNLAPLLDATTS
jgi:FAD dependent oxidoreductase TIGR03364